MSWGDRVTMFRYRHYVTNHHRYSRLTPPRKKFSFWLSKTSLVAASVCKHQINATNPPFFCLASFITKGKDKRN